MDSLRTKECVHCKLCTKKCGFLSKYHMDLESFAQHPELAYHCFLCGTCKAVCPQKIDGRAIALHLRKEEVTNNNGQLKRDEYKGLLWEKNPYKFDNYKRGHTKTVLFLGCNFPSFYPKATKELTGLFEKKGIGIIYDCCQKPTEELGLLQDAKINIASIDKKLKDLGVEEVVVLCPNCYHFLKGKIDARIVTVYEKMRQLQIGTPITTEVLPVYYPCPDRADKEMMQDILFYIKGQVQHPFTKTQCCGLGGCAKATEPELSRGMVESVKRTDTEVLYTYCASCISHFRRGGFAKAYHLLPMILGVEEKVPLGIKPLWNRMKLKLK